MDGLMVCTPIISLDPILRYLKNIHVRPSKGQNDLQWPQNVWDTFRYVFYLYVLICIFGP